MFNYALVQKHSYYAQPTETTRKGNTCIIYRSVKQWELIIHDYARNMVIHVHLFVIALPNGLLHRLLPIVWVLNKEIPDSPHKAITGVWKWGKVQVWPTWRMHFDKHDNPLFSQVYTIKNAFYNYFHAYLSHTTIFGVTNWVTVLSTGPFLVCQSV